MIGPKKEPRPVTKTFQSSNSRRSSSSVATAVGEATFTAITCRARVAFVIQPRSIRGGRGGEGEGALHPTTTVDLRARRSNPFPVLVPADQRAHRPLDSHACALTARACPCTKFTCAAPSARAPPPQRTHFAQAALAAVAGRPTRRLRCVRGRQTQRLAR